MPKRQGKPENSVSPRQYKEMKIIRKSQIKILELNEGSLPSGTCPTNEPKEAVFKQPNVAFSPASL